MAGLVPFSLFSSRNRPFLFGLVLLLTALAGVGGFRASQNTVDSHLRGELLDQAVALARTIHPDQVAALTFTAADKQLPEFQRLRGQMMGYQAITTTRGIYSLALRNGSLIFGPESYAEDDPQASPPGTVYQQPGTEDFAIFDTGVAIVEGPYADEYGNFISALAPIFDPRTREVLMVVGVDMETSVYEAALLRAGLGGLLPALVLGVIVLGGLSVSWWRERLPAPKQGRLRYVEIYSIAIFGIAASLLAAQTFSDAQAHSRAASFKQLAETNAQLVIKAFSNLQDYRLGSIVQFFTGSQFVERDEFRVFVDPLLQGAAIQALEWVPNVPASQRADVEEQARADGEGAFFIWESSPSGGRQPAGPRSVYFPILYAEPRQGNEIALGYDQGSEPARDAALLNALATNLPTASDPILPVQDKESQPSLLAVAPVFASASIQQTQTGFVVAVVHLEPFLQSALFIGPAGDESTVVELYQLEGNQEPRFIASSSSAHTEIHNVSRDQVDEFQANDKDTLNVFPLFIFDKSYALVVHEAAAAAAGPFSAGLTAALSGLVFTALVTSFASYILARRDDLATMVQARTAQLRENEAYLSTLLDTMSDAVFITRMPERNVEYVNHAVTEIFGYSTDDVVGQTTKKFYAGSGYADYGRQVREAIAIGETNVRSEVKLLHKDGHTIWGEMNATVRFHNDQPASLITVVRDISERIQAKERIETQLNRLGALHNIDVAISSSLDLQTVLGVVLDQTTAHLGMDAACVLLLDSRTQTLTYGAGRGFRSKNIEGVKLRLGESVAGQVALKREMIQITNPAEDPRFASNGWIKTEGFAEYFATPLIAKGKVSGVLEIYKRTPFEADEEWWGFLKTLAGEAAIAVDSARLLQDLQRANVNIVHAYDATIEGWSQALDLRDRETKGHTQRVTEMTLKLARGMGIGEVDLVDMRRGALLHDIGKIGVPDSILLKTGTLTADEWELMHKHPRFAFDMLSPITYLMPALDIPYCHHEKWDGSGYPRGLKGEQIPLAARIFAVGDVYDALVSDRPYRKAVSKQEALAYIREQSGKHFDPKVADLFLKQVDGK
jgi:PAS domain S-box-containing protein